ncbi:restriction endonuclease [Frankia sp. R82]|uniref:restriction endonuclease n=1 Tax=Frankia sp. R82 TaxID=2950553 RepID=UPI0020430B39|nr:restriction endonuclease [Frankia sp. R82]MCM3885048.1 restriction endonuclease [Frankia sp. R82]
MIAPNYADLSELRVVAAETELLVTTSTQLLAGAQLVTVPLDDFDFAVAVLPATGADGTPASVPPAIYVELGVVLGRGLPLLVLAENPEDELPGFGGVAGDVWVIAGAIDEASLRLNLDLFDKVTGLRRRTGGHGPMGKPPVLVPGSALRGQLRAAAGQLEREVFELLKADGALVEEAADLGRDTAVDAAAVLPGVGGALGPVLVQVKALQGRDLSRAVRDLARAVSERGASLGVVVYDGPRQQPRTPADIPIVVLHVDDLRQRVEQHTLGRQLVEARNYFIHGPRGDI